MIILYQYMKICEVIDPRKTTLKTNNGTVSLFTTQRNDSLMRSKQNITTEQLAYGKSNDQGISISFPHNHLSAIHQY